ncbi:hypothetical protein [Sphingobacterium sp. IITKGP-BTPF85]|uniref:hypothetical protein n=1 Tax=Sphingobacterium sp. IITKGP-BTPF85 TaxID=1338009 RepID=UPI000389EF0F|nr:hypothetical protein [Sphingobacterium sp. IITKGP-BTPF85]KKX48345.1 hypothetical protein L950_0221575 [Sphingobacterium sp. IITKGP-BTPF85]
MAKSLKQSKKSIRNNLIDDLISKTGTDKGEFRFNMNVLEEVVAEFIENVKNEINAIDGFLTTGSIEELSIKVNNMSQVQVIGMQHVIYMSRGINGTEQNNGSIHSYTTLKPPIAPIKQWIRDKQLLTKNNSKFFKDPVFDDMDTEEKVNALAGAIRQNIFKKGIQAKGNNYWDRNISLLQQELNIRVQQNLSQQIKYAIYNQYGDNVQKKKG